MRIREFQDTIEAIYGDRDRRRGPARSFLWFVEEVGELSEEVRHAAEGSGDRDSQRRLIHEVSDVLAWLTTLASMLDVDLEEAAARYADGCPVCRATPCACAEA